MTPSEIFPLVTHGAMLLWIALALAPRNRLLTDLIAPVLAPAVLGTLYLGLLLAAAPTLEGGFGSLAAVSTLFQDPTVLLGGWIHYLAFDLFVGSWEARDARRLGISRWQLLPCLLLTFLLGPLGLLAYLAIRGALRKRLATEVLHAGVA